MITITIGSWIFVPIGMTVGILLTDVIRYFLSKKVDINVSIIIGVWMTTLMLFLNGYL